MATFYIRKDSKTGGFVIIRVNGEYDQHSHVKTMAGCQQVMRLVELGLEPKQPWMQTAVRRLLTEDEYAKLKRCKDKYVIKGGRHG